MLPTRRLEPVAMDAAASDAGELASLAVASMGPRSRRDTAPVAGEEAPSGKAVGAAGPIDGMTAISGQPVAQVLRQGESPAAATLPRGVAMQVQEAVLAQYRVVQDAGRATFQVQLTPPDLGPLRIEMERTSRGISIRVAAGLASTHALLTSGRDELAASLAGLHGGDVQFDIFAEAGGRGFGRDRQSPVTEPEDGTGTRRDPAPVTSATTPPRSRELDLLA